MEALARFDIRTDGTAAVALVQPTQSPALNRIILDTLKTWRFLPAMEGDRPVASTQEVRIHLQVQ
jgi:periplasmic protein TonB